MFDFPRAHSGVFYSFIDSANGSVIACMYAAGWVFGCGAINQGGRG